MITMKENPPWANRILTDNWSAIEAEIKDPALMPLEADSSTPRKRAFAELGCGHYGCVYRTATPGMVFKISTDASEVEFVKAAMKLGGWPSGIVRYHAVLEVEGLHRGRPAFVVWREEAFDVGQTSGYHAAARAGIQVRPDLSREEKEWMRYHDAYRLAASYVRAASTKPSWTNRLAGARRMEQWAWSNVVWEDGLARGLYEDTKPRFMVLPASQRLAAALRICGICFELMEHTNFASEVGAALGFYLDHGILLADVHMNNVGRVHRRDEYGEHEITVITDPGHAVFLGGER